MHIKNVIKRFFLILKKSILFSPNFFLIKLIITLLGVMVSAINMIFPKYLLLALKSQNVYVFFLTVIIIVSTSFFLNSIIIFLNPQMSSASEEMNAKVIDEFLKKSISIQLSSFEEKGFYNKYTLVFEKCCEIFQTVNVIFFQAISAVIQVLVILFILSWMDKFYLCILLFFACFQTFIGNLIKRINYQYRVKMVKNSKYLNYLYRLFNIPEFMRDVRINSLFNFIFAKKQKVSQKIINDTFETQQNISKKSLAQNAASLFETIIITTYFGYMVIKGKIWIDTFVVSQNSYTQLKNAMLNILSLYNNLYENDLYILDYFKFLNSENEIKSGNMLIEKNVEEIEFVNVFFSYSNSWKNAINNISFKIRKGEKILITGQNGSGKTTLIKLLLRLYEPNSGTILINGIDIKKYAIEELRKSISVLFQDYAVYAFTIYENICLGRNISENEIENTLEAVGLKKVIEQLSLGIETPISCQIDDNGIELSGGEKQRLATARTLLKDSKVIIFDEPTSNLDALTKKKIFKALLSDNERITIIISHDLSFSCEVSKIVCLNNGNLVETGTHEQLLKNTRGVYATLYNNFIEGK